MAGKRAMVTVSRQGVSAFEEPRILFEADGKLYLSMAVLEYDPRHHGLTDEQRQAIRHLEQALERGDRVRAVHVNLAALGGGIIGANTVGPGAVGAGDDDNS